MMNIKDFDPRLAAFVSRTEAHDGCLIPDEQALRSIDAVLRAQGGSFSDESTIEAFHDAIEALCDDSFAIGLTTFLEDLAGAHA
jgi:hypothetical protein